MTIINGDTGIDKITDGSVVQADLASGVAGTGPAFSAYSDPTTSIPNVTFTKVEFQNEDFDTNNNFASSRFTPNVAGYYQINAKVIIVLNDGTQIITSIFKNGVRFKDGARFYNGATGGAGSAVASLIYLNGSTDYVEIYVYQDTGTSKDVQIGEAETYFNGFLARAV